MGTNNFGASSRQHHHESFYLLIYPFRYWPMWSIECLLDLWCSFWTCHAAYGAAVATKRGFRNIALEGFSEDYNQDGFVDPIGQVVAPVTYAAPYYGYHHALPVVKVEAPKAEEVKVAPVVTYAHAAPVLTHPVTYTHTLTRPVTYTHTVPAGVLTH